MVKADDDFDPNDILRRFDAGAGQKTGPLDVDAVLQGFDPHPQTIEIDLDAVVPKAERERARDWDVDDVIDVAPLQPVDRAELTVDELVIDVPASEPDATAADDDLVIDVPEVDDAVLPATEDLDAVVTGVSRRAAAAADVEDIEASWEPATAVAMRRTLDPRLLRQWQPGAWTGAARRAFGAVTQFVQTPDGPVVETYATHHLVALWMPQGPETPLLGRWPQRVVLCPVDDDAVGDALLKLVPPDRSLWLTDLDIDWALVGELALHHTAHLPAFQEKALREFIEAERVATFGRVNDGYRQPVPGAPIQPRIAGDD